MSENKKNKKCAICQRSFNRPGTRICPLCQEPGYIKSFCPFCRGRSILSKDIIKRNSNLFNDPAQLERHERLLKEKGFLVFFERGCPICRPEDKDGTCRIICEGHYNVK